MWTYYGLNFTTIQIPGTLLIKQSVYHQISYACVIFRNISEAHYLCLFCSEDNYQRLFFKPNVNLDPVSNNRAFIIFMHTHFQGYHWRAVYAISFEKFFLKLWCGDRHKIIIFFQIFQRVTENSLKYCYITLTLVKFMELTVWSKITKALFFYLFE